MLKDFRGQKKHFANFYGHHHHYHPNLFEQA